MHGGAEQAGGSHGDASQELVRESGELDKARSSETLKSSIASSAMEVAEGHVASVRGALEGSQRLQ